MLPQQVKYSLPMENTYIPNSHTIEYIMTEYYDFVLGLIPIAFFTISGGLSLTGMATPTAVTIGAAVGVLIVCHALFVNSPADDSTSAGVVDANAQSNSTGGMQAD